MKKFEVTLAGVTAENRQEVIRELVVNSEIPDFMLVREPDNPYDPNAVRVDVWGFDDMTVGYLPRHLAMKIAPLMDAGTIYDGKLVWVNRHPRYNTVGLTIKFFQIDKRGKLPMKIAG